MKSKNRSLTVRAIAVLTAVIATGGVFMASDSSRAQSTPNDELEPWWPSIASSMPSAEATGVVGDLPITIRFNQAMSPDSLNEHNVTLFGPTGPEPIRVVPIDGGTQVVVWPIKELLPSSRYTVFLAGVCDPAQHALPLSTIGFDTALKSAASKATAFAATAEVLNSNDDWLPGAAHLTGRWRADRPDSPMQALPPLQARPGVTALAGQVLGMNGRPVPEVTLRIGGREARSDRTGRFLVEGLDYYAGKLEIDGETADTPASRYGYYAARVELVGQRTNVLPYTIWMPRLDPAGNVRLAAPTTSETVVTSARIPGLELHIPAGTVIRDRSGHIVTELNITPIPTDRPPFPVPDLGVPTYFTIQPGGAVLESATGQPNAGARLFYPNFRNEVAGARGVFWNYDPEERGWFVYGIGRISADRTQAIPDDGVVIHELTGAMFNGAYAPPPKGAPPCDCGDSNGGSGDSGAGAGGAGGGGGGGGTGASGSVNLFTGQFTYGLPDLGLHDTSPITVTPSYNSADVNQRGFGVGMSDPNDTFLFSQHQYTETDQILPDGTYVHYERISPGTGYTDAIFRSTSPGPWNQAILARNNTKFGWDLIFRDGRHWYFPQYQPVTEMTDANGNTTHIVRQDNNGTAGKVARIVSPNGRTLRYSYNAAGFVSALTDDLGRSVGYSYDTSGRLTNVTTPLGGGRHYTWDTANNRITSVQDTTGHNQVQIQYDGAGRVHQQTLSNGSAFTYAYTTASGVVTQTDTTDPRGSIRRVNFDATGYVVKNTFPLGLPEQQVINYEVTDGVLTASVDGLGRRTEYQHDSSGNPTQVTRLAGTSGATSAHVTYDPSLNSPLTMTDANGNTMSFVYDSRGNVLEAHDALDHVTSFTYDSQGRLKTQTNPLGKTKTVTYDGADLSVVQNALGRQVQAFTDAAGRTIATLDAMGNRSTLVWDDMNRLTSITDALGGVTSFAYDTRGNQTSHTDPKGHTTSYTYTASNQVETATDPLGKVSSATYDDSGMLLQSINRRGQLSRMTYDVLGRMKTLSIGATSSQPMAFTSRIENTWDAGNRLIQVVDKTCSAPTIQLDCALVASTSTTTRTYDSLDRLTSEVSLQGEVDYTYDSGGRRASMTVKNGAPGAQTTQPTISYSYDAANRLTGITQAAGTINGNVAQHITLAYDNNNRRTQTTLANGSTVHYGYNDGNQLTSIVYKRADNSTIGDLQYSYDVNGRRTHMSGSLAQVNVPATDVTDATYDANDRLLTWGGQSYAYDDAGNLTSDGSNTYAWTDRGQLSSVTSSSSTAASFQYDSAGRRSGKTINGQSTGFVYDGVSQVQELSGLTNSSSVKSHSLNGGVDEVFLRAEGNTGSSLQSVLGDSQGSTLMLLDSSQNKLVSYAYEPYGATTADATSSNAAQYTGRENDNPGNSQGLYYYRARYYMPGIARFISEDPLGWGSGQTNPYAYAGGDPISFRDPMGTDILDAFENFSAGFGDKLTFGLGKKLRGWLGIDGVDVCSGWYSAGSVGGTIAQFAALGAAGKALGAALEGGEGAEATYQILDGVRRAKAARIAAEYAEADGGISAAAATIRAELYGSGGKIIDVPINSLLSPKAIIDISSAKDAARWATTLSQTLLGERAPAILIQPGSIGTPIIDVLVDIL